MDCLQSRFESHLDWARGKLKTRPSMAKSAAYSICSCFPFLRLLLFPVRDSAEAIFVTFLGRELARGNMLNPMEHYGHTQTGTVILTGIAMAATASTSSLLLADLGTLALLVVVILSLLALGFGALTISVDRTNVTLRFGVQPLRGWFTKRFPLGDIISVRKVRNSWLYGFAIRYTPHGWLYCVSGLDAIELSLANGKSVRIGTDQVDALRAAITGATGVSVTTQSRSDTSSTTVLLVLIGLLSSVALLIGWVFLSGTRAPEITYDTGAFTVRGQYTTTVAFSDIRDISLATTHPTVLRRLNGFSAMGQRRGIFELEDIGDGYLFSSNGHSPYVIIDTISDFVIINYEDPSRTRKLFKKLRLHWTR